MRDIKKRIANKYPLLKLQSFRSVYRAEQSSKIKYWGIGIMALCVVIIFLPWTQNIHSDGSVTTLTPQGRMQEINSVIAGKITKWHINDGEIVSAGDTLLTLAEIKDEYLDPELLNRTRQQMEAKDLSILSYTKKIAANEEQMEALSTGLTIKLNNIDNKILQLYQKIIADSFSIISSKNDYDIANAQYKRQLVMRDSGLSSMVHVEQRLKTVQNTLAKKAEADTKLAIARTELLNAKLEKQALVQEVVEKKAKVLSDRATAQGEIANSQGELSKLANQYSNYSIRAGQYFVTAPQAGQVVAATKSGLLEMVKAGEKLMEIVPLSTRHAVEIFVTPMDLPLLRVGQLVRFQFDGYPAVVFSGWPEASYGMFDGRVAIIENATNRDGKFRILVREDTTSRPWPSTLTFGTGAKGIALLQDVPIWYEIWRNINGFPPDYYKKNKTGKENYAE